MLQAAEPPTDVTFTNLGIVDWKRATAEDEAPPDSGAPWWKRWKRPPVWATVLAAGLAALLLIEFILLIVALATWGRK